MKETAFIKNNKKKWEDYEQKLSNIRRLKPDETGEIYINLNDDLSFARSNYPQSQLVHYLNNLASSFHHNIYQNKKTNWKRIYTFWTQELPQVMAQHQKELLYSFLIFATSIGIGALSQANDESFARLIMGDAYVNMTQENIENNDPMGVYKSMTRMNMFLFITINNIRVSFIVFVGGILTSLFTGYLLFKNGVMLGCFQYFFYQKGLFITSFLTIWLHGTIEISAIIIAGAAGIVMGNGLLFPKTYSRIESLKRSAKQGVKIAIGLAPLFVVAGFIEGFITRLTDMPAFLKILIIAFSALFIIAYFVVYPQIIKRNASKSKD